MALSEGNLIQVLERYNPYPRARLRGMDQAVEELRDDIEVDVWRNEFLSEDPRDVLGRAARVAIGYKHADAAVAWNVVEALVKATVDEQRQMRKAQVAYLARGLDPALQRAREELAQRQVEFARAQVESARSRMASVRLYGLREDIERLQGEVDRLRVSRDEAQLRLQVENLDLGLQADIIDQERPQPRPYRARVMAFFALVFGLCALVLGGVVLKAFDRGVYDIEDVRRLGYSVWGALPPYPGEKPLPTADYAALFRGLGLGPGGLAVAWSGLPDQAPASGVEGVGSNNWVVTPGASTTGCSTWPARVASFLSCVRTMAR